MYKDILNSRIRKPFIVISNSINCFSHVIHRDYSFQGPNVDLAIYFTLFLNIIHRDNF